MSNPVNLNIRGNNLELKPEYGLNTLHFRVGLPRISILSITWLHVSPFYAFSVVLACKVRGYILDLVGRRTPNQRRSAYIRPGQEFFI